MRALRRAVDASSPRVLPPPAMDGAPAADARVPVHAPAPVNSVLAATVAVAVRVKAAAPGAQREAPRGRASMVEPLVRLDADYGVAVCGGDGCGRADTQRRDSGGENQLGGSHVPFTADVAREAGQAAAVSTTRRMAGSTRRAAGSGRCGVRFGRSRPHPRQRARRPGRAPRRLHPAGSSVVTIILGMGLPCEIWRYPNAARRTSRPLGGVNPKCPPTVAAQRSGAG